MSCVDNTLQYNSGAVSGASSRDRERDRWSPRTARRSISRAAALFPVQHAQERLDRLITFRGRQSTQFPEERRVAGHLGGPQRAAHDPRPQRALSRGR